MSTVTREPVAATAAARWGWAGALVLLALWTVAHVGCHGDRDAELSLPAPAQRPAR